MHMHFLPDVLNTHTNKHVYAPATGLLDEDLGDRLTLAAAAIAGPELVAAIGAVGALHGHTPSANALCTSCAKQYFQI